MLAADDGKRHLAHPVSLARDEVQHEQDHHRARDDCRDERHQDRAPVAEDVDRFLACDRSDARCRRIAARASVSRGGPSPDPRGARTHPRAFPRRSARKLGGGADRDIAAAEDDDPPAQPTPRITCG